MRQLEKDKKPSPSQQAKETMQGRTLQELLKIQGCNDVAELRQQIMFKALMLILEQVAKTHDHWVLRFMLEEQWKLTQGHTDQLYSVYKN